MSGVAPKFLFEKWSQKHQELLLNEMVLSFEFQALRREWGAMFIRGITAALLVLAAAITAPGWASDVDDGDMALHKGDYASALKLLMPYAQRGNMIAELDIGLLYFSGHGLPQDRSKAAKWFLLAAQQGNLGAQTNLGILYAVGDGVPQSDVIAYMWFSLAASQKTENSQSASIQYRDHVAGRMSPDDIQRATALAKQCKTSKYVICGTIEEIVRQCNDRDPDLRISGCTGLIQSGRETSPPGFAFRNRAEGYSDKQDGQRAIADYTQAIQIDPNDIGALRGRGFWYAVLYDYVHAVEDLTKVLQHDPNDREALNNRGSAFLHLRDYDRALADLNRCIQLDPNDTGALQNRAVTFMAKGNFDAAISDLDRILKLKPADASALFARGQAKRAKGDTSGGDADITEAERIKPGIER
jgi:tetratricopeptide (TPR) repeat protein